MDTDMTDAGYDIDIDVGAGLSAPAQQPTQVIEQQTAPKESNDMPAAYYENLDTQPQKAWPEILNLQGVNDFDPNDPLYYIMEHCGADPRAKQLRWVSDSSVNLEFYNPADAAAALLLLTHEEVGNANALGLQDSRRAKTYSKKPDSVLRVREANDGDQKPKGAANRSNYYQRNPDVRGNREREPRKRQPPKRDFLDYGEEDQGSRGPGDRRRRRSSGDESMGEDSGVERRRNNTRRNDRDTRGRGGRMRDDRGRDGRSTGRLRDDRDAGRLGADVDSYRPGERSPRESHFGRLRGRSASPTSNDGDGRFGFAEDNSNVRTRYRSRSRSRNNARRRREPSSERWTHDRANYGASGGRWQKDAAPSFDSSPMGNHRRSDAMDQTGKGGSLLARMTKDGRPVVPQTRSLADRITRDDDDDRSYGRLKHDDSEPAFNDFSEPKPRRNLVDRISRDTEINIRGRGQEGINIRGTANDGSAGGINIRGVASGA